MKMAAMGVELFWLIWCYLTWDVSPGLAYLGWPSACPGNCRIGPVHFLAGWHNRRSNQDSVSFGLVLCMFVVFINGCLGFCNAMLCISAAFTVVWCLSVWLAVCHICVLCQNGKRCGHSCYAMQIAFRTKTSEWYHFQWPWTISNINFKNILQFLIARKL